MKFKSATLNIRETTTVTLRVKSGLDLTITVGSIPMGVTRKYKDIYPMPRPPFTEVMKAGQAKPERIDNYDDPAFVAAYDQWKELERIYLFCVVTSADPDLQFESVHGTPKNSADLLAIRKELDDAGFSDYDIAHVLERASAISVITDTDIEAARANLQSSLTK